MEEEEDIKMMHVIIWDVDLHTCGMSPGCKFWCFCSINKDYIKEKGKHISLKLIKSGWVIDIVFFFITFRVKVMSVIL